MTGKYGERCKFVTSLLLLLSFGSLIGCTPTFSKHLRQNALTPISFQDLVEKGEDYRGELVILGGHILTASNEPDGSLLTVLQAPLDSGDRPKSQDLSEGRFMVRTKEFLDPEIYSKGRKLSLVGKVSGVELELLGNLMYRYPVIEPEELHLWPEEKRYARPYYPYHYWPHYWYHPWPYPYRAYPWWY